MNHVTFRGTTPLLTAPTRIYGNYCIFVQEGRRAFFYTAKWPQWPHLYLTYEATYTPNCLFQKILQKNWFFGSATGVFDEISISWPRNVLQTFPIQQNLRNGHIYIRVMKQHISWNAFFLRKTRKTDLVVAINQKLVFCDFLKEKLFQSICCFKKSNIDVAIANILLCQISLYNVQKSGYECLMLHRTKIFCQISTYIISSII